jgi:hypothetical protein
MDSLWGRDHDADQGVISQRRYPSLCSSNAQMAASWRIGLFAIFAAILNQKAVLLLFLSFCVGLIPRKIKSTQNDEEPKTVTHRSDIYRTMAFVANVT